MCPPLSLGWDEPTKAPPRAVPPAALHLHLSYRPLHTDVAKSQGTPLTGIRGWGWWKMCGYVCVCVCVCVHVPIYVHVWVCFYVCICLEGGSIPRHKLLSFLESLWPTQEERVGGEGGGGEGTEALGEQSLISNLPKTGVFMLWCWGPLLCREMLSQRCNIHLGIGLGGGGGCIGLQCYTKYPGALTSLMKSPLAAATHYCTLLCLSHRDL